MNIAGNEAVAMIEGVGSRNWHRHTRGQVPDRFACSSLRVSERPDRDRNRRRPRRPLDAGRGRDARGRRARPAARPGPERLLTRVRSCRRRADVTGRLPDEPLRLRRSRRGTTAPRHGRDPARLRGRTSRATHAFSQAGAAPDSDRSLTPDPNSSFRSRTNRSWSTRPKTCARWV